MIPIDVEQGTEEWLRARMAIPTASQFHRIITPAKMEMSKQSIKYASECLAEYLLNEPLRTDLNRGIVERGNAMEAEAVTYYELLRDVDVQRIGFALLDDGVIAELATESHGFVEVGKVTDPAATNRMVGCSPDGLVGDDGGLEVKCPGPAQHVLNILEMKQAYELQCQGCMWICERQWWDVLSYHPAIGPEIVRYERDDELIAKIATAVEQFVIDMLEARAFLTNRRKGLGLDEVAA